MSDGSGLCLRPWNLDRDREALIRVLDDPEVAFRTPIPSPFGLEEADEYLRRDALNDRIHLAICDNDAIVGEIALNLATNAISYTVARDQRGRGFATRAVNLLATRASALGVHEVWLEIEPDNEPSIAVARRCGFVPTSAGDETVEDKGRTYVLQQWCRSLDGPT